MRKILLPEETEPLAEGELCSFPGPHSRKTGGSSTHLCPSLCPRLGWALRAHPQIATQTPEISQSVKQKKADNFHPAFSRPGNSLKEERRGKPTFLVCEPRGRGPADFIAILRRTVARQQRVRTAVGTVSGIQLVSARMTFNRICQLFKYRNAFPGMPDNPAVVRMCLHCLAVPSPSLGPPRTPQHGPAM